MNSRLIVSTECPTCGASLDFTEGSHAIQCGHCRSRLLVTGRKQLLSYAISPKLDVHRAAAKALLAQKPEDILFFCTSCARGWQIEGSALSQIDYQVAHPPTRRGVSRYLPFWVLQAEMDQNPSFRFFLPAFRYRRLKLLGDLAKQLSKMQPTYTISAESFIPSQGGCYDQEDAALPARFTWAGLQGKQGMKEREEKPFLIRGATLTWFPFQSEGNELRDPFTGMNLPQNLFV